MSAQAKVSASDVWFWYLVGFFWWNLKLYEVTFTSSEGGSDLQFIFKLLGEFQISYFACELVIFIRLTCYSSHLQCPSKMFVQENNFYTFNMKRNDHQKDRVGEIFEKLVELTWNRLLRTDVSDLYVLSLAVFPMLLMVKEPSGQEFQWKTTHPSTVRLRINHLNYSIVLGIYCFINFFFLVFNNVKMKRVC